MQYLYPYFPPHKMRIDLFFGAGGAYFNLPKPKFAILNDLDDEVTNLYLIVQTRKEELIEELRKLPISTNMVRYWKTHHEADDLRKALRFLFLSNFTMMGKGDTLRLGYSNTKQVTIDSINRCFQELGNVKITNDDFRDVIPKLQFTKGVCTKTDAFVYMDPIYLDTIHTYKVPKWSIDDTMDCFDIIQKCGIRSGMSEFDHPMIIKEAKKRGFRIIFLTERRNISNRRREVLIANYYESSQLTFF